MNFVLENPKAVITAASGVIIFVLKTYVFKDTFTLELSSWLDIILSSLFLILIGRYTRIQGMTIYLNLFFILVLI